MPCQIPLRLRFSIVALFWTVRNMEKIKSARQLVRQPSGLVKLRRMKGNNLAPAP